MDAPSVAWWVWVVLGFVLLVFELLTPGGFYIFFFGLGAILVGLLKLAGLNSLVLEGLIFAVSSVVMLILFRRKLLEQFKPKQADLPLDNLAMEIAVAMEDIPAGAVGKVELRGTSWNAQNMHSGLIARAQRCRVEKIDGLTLHVRPV